MKIIILLLAVLISAPGHAHYDEAYYHGSSAVADNSGWMAAVDGSKLLSQLSVVGTHNSMSLYGGDIVQTQSMSLINQLNSGVRTLDIRAKYDDGNMAIYHGIFFQYAYLGNDVFSVVSDFLLQNPTETIIMHIQQEENDNPVGLKFTEQISEQKRIFRLIWCHRTTAWMQKLARIFHKLPRNSRRTLPL